jgi:hypothetical protein
MISSKWIVAAVASNVLFACSGWAQPAERASAASPSVDERIDHLTQEVEELKGLVRQLQSQLAAQATPAAPMPLSNTRGVLEASQQAIGVGLVWWFGQKQGVW